jgi:hypothetical protein
VQDLQSNLNQVLAQAKQFAGDLKTLIAEGAGQGLIEQIVGMGPQAGDVLAEQLIQAGQGSVQDLSSTLDQISAYSDQAAGEMAASFYGGGVDAMEQFIEGLMKAFPELSAALKPVLQLLDSVFGPGTSAMLAGTPFAGENLSSYDLSGGKHLWFNGSEILDAKTAPKGFTQIPGFAAGVTDFGGGYALVGESGPEVIYMPPGSDVYPSHQLADAIATTRVPAMSVQMPAADPMLDRLDRIEAAVLSTPAANGRHVGAAVSGEFRSAAETHAATVERIHRKGSG